jgi:predicted DNA-binding protein
MSSVKHGLVQVSFNIPRELHTRVTKRMHSIGATKAAVLRKAIERGMDATERPSWHDELRREIILSGGISAEDFESGLWAWLESMVAGFSPRGVANQLKESLRRRTVLGTGGDTP